MIAARQGLSTQDELMRLRLRQLQREQEEAERKAREQAEREGAYRSVLQQGGDPGAIRELDAQFYPEREAARRAAPMPAPNVRLDWEYRGDSKRRARINPDGSLTPVPDAQWVKRWEPNAPGKASAPSASQLETDGAYQLWRSSGQPVRQFLEELQYTDSGLARALLRHPEVQAALGSGAPAAPTPPPAAKSQRGDSPANPAPYLPGDKLVVGRWYRAPSGAVAKWNGRAFEVEE